MTKQSKLYGLAGLIAVCLGLIGKAWYREFINQNSINDYGIAGFLPSYFYVIGFSLLLSIRLAKNIEVVVFIVTTASILFEIKQYYTTSALDIKDIIASILGGGTALIVSNFIRKTSNK